MASSLLVRKYIMQKKENSEQDEMFYISLLHSWNSLLRSFEVSRSVRVAATFNFENTV